VPIWRCSAPSCSLLTMSKDVKKATEHTLTGWHRKWSTIGWLRSCRAQNQSTVELASQPDSYWLSQPVGVVDFGGKFKWASRLDGLLRSFSEAR
jgi:hypothetical protein